MATNSRLRQKRLMLVMSGAMLSILTTMAMMMHLTPSEPVKSGADESLKGKVDTALANIGHNVAEANFAVGRMNINGINKDDCAALLKANDVVRINADFVLANNPALLAQGKITKYAANDTAQLMVDITKESDEAGAPDAVRLVTAQRCLAHT